MKTILTKKQAARFLEMMQGSTFQALSYYNECFCKQKRSLHEFAFYETKMIKALFEVHEVLFTKTKETEITDKAILNLAYQNLIDILVEAAKQKVEEN